MLLNSKLRKIIKSKHKFVEKRLPLLPNGLAMISMQGDYHQVWFSKVLCQLHNSMMLWRKEENGQLKDRHSRNMHLLQFLSVYDSNTEKVRI